MISSFALYAQMVSHYLQIPRLVLARATFFGLVMTLWLLAASSLAFAADPINVRVTPSTVVSNVGVASTFAATYSDADGASDIKQAYAVFNTGVVGTNSLFCYYDATNNLLKLASNAGSLTDPGYAPGSDNVLINSQGSLNCQTTTVARDGNNLTVYWNVTPTSTYTGLKNVLISAKDAAGHPTNGGVNSGYEDKGDWLINSTPTNGSLTPNSVSSNSGVPKTLTAIYTDPDGALDIKEAWILVHTGESGANTLYGYYNSTDNKLFLRDDADTAWIGGFTPGSNNVIYNNQGSLNCATTSVSRSGNNLTVAWNLTPNNYYSGSKNIYLSARDAALAKSAVEDKGDWSINAFPLNEGIDPGGFVSSAGSAKTISALYSDGNGVSDIKDAYLLVNTAVVGTNSLFCWYDAVANELHLADNTGAFGPGYTPGSNNSPSNSQGTLNCATTSVVRDGKNLTVKWSITPSSSYTGQKNVYLRVRDVALALDDFEDKGDWLIKGAANTAPVNVSVTPTSFGSTAGLATTIPAVYSDTDGALDIKEAYFLAQTAVNGTNALFAYYDQVANKLYLRDDANANWIGGFVPGSDKTIASSQGTLNCGATTVVRGTNTLTIYWSFTPASTFTGIKNVYLRASDSGALINSFEDKADWNIKSSNSVPLNVSVTPKNLSSAVNVAKNLVATYSDPDGTVDIKEARLLLSVDGTGANALMGCYTNGLLYLRGNDGLTYQGGFAPGSNNTITNNQGILNCSATTVSTAGNTLTINWNFTPNSTFTDLKNVYAMVIDYGPTVVGWDDMGDWVISSSNVAPLNEGIDPGGFVSSAGSAKTISALYSDGNGVSDIKDAYLLVNTAVVGTNSLFCWYDAVANELHLADNTGAFGPGYTPGSNNSPSNSQGTLNCATTSVVRDGKNLTVKWSITPSSSYTGQKNVYLRVRDVALALDDFEDKGDWLIKGAANTAPVNVSVTPTSFGSTAGLATTIPAVYSDTDGALDIKEAYLLVHTGIVSTNSLYCYYDAINDKLYLAPDAGSPWGPGYAPGSDKVLTNSQGSLNCAATTVVRNSGAITVNWNVTPASTYIGSKNVYLRVRDTSGALDDFEDKGDWLINVTPVNLSVSPTSVTSSAGVAHTTTVVYGDNNGGADIVDARIVINTGLSNTNCLSATYDRATNKLYLYSNDGASLLGGFTPGSSNTISNNQGTLNCAQTSVSTVGTSVTINWNFTPNVAIIPNYTFILGKPQTINENIYVYCRDTQNVVTGWSQLATWSITDQAPTTPKNAWLSPSSGTSSPGTARTLTTTYSDANGASDMALMRILINSQVNTTANSLFGQYNAVENKLYLYADDGTTPLGGFAPGSAHQISNSQGVLDCEKTTVILTDTDVVINWGFVPSASFAGYKDISLYVKDVAGALDNFEHWGNWTIDTAPQLLSVMGSVTNNTVAPQLAWSPRAGSANYKIYRRTEGTNYSLITTVAGSLTSWTDSALTAAGAIYYYAITSVNTASQESPKSNEIGIGTGTFTDTPDPVMAVPGDSQVSLSWSPVMGAISYHVYRIRRLNNQDIASWDFFCSNLSCVDGEALSPGHAPTNNLVYYYKIVPVNASGEDDSHRAQTYYVTPQALAGVPTGLTASTTNNVVNLSWTAGANATSYIVLRSNKSGGPYFKVSPFVNPTGTSYADSSGQLGTTYFYVVKAVNACGESAPSSEAQVTLSSPAVTFSKVGATNVTVHLPQLPSGATSFTLERATEGQWSSNLPTGMQAWYRADSITGIGNGSAVRSWADLSGNGLTASSRGGQSDPVWVTDALGGRPSVRFDDVDDALNIAPCAPTYTSGFSAFAVYKKHSNDPGHIIQFDGDKSTWSVPDVTYYSIGLAAGNANNRGYYLNASQYLTVGDTVNTDQFQTFGVIHQGGAVGAQTAAELFVNGISKLTGNLPVSPTILRSGNVIGNHPMLSRPFGGDIAEVLLYNRALNSSERINVDSYLARRYGFERTMPALTWYTVATGLEGGKPYIDSTVFPNTTYWYRVVANSSPSVTSIPSSVTTDAVAPATPGTPAFTNVQTTSVTVNSSPVAWPTGATFLKIQQKLASSPDSQYLDVNCAKQTTASVVPFIVKNLEPGTKYRFRFVALCEDTATTGPSAEVTTATATSGQGGGLLGTYFRNGNFTGPVLSKIDPTIDFNWNNYSPNPNIPTDNFSIRWEGQIQPAFSENYVFSTSADDTMKIWIDGVAISTGVAVPMVANQKYNIQIDFQEITGLARAQLFWQSTQQGLQVVPADRLYAPQGNGTGLRAQYFLGQDFDQQVTSRIDSQIAFGWPDDGPMQQLKNKSFSVWWTGQIQPRFTQTYTFHALGRGLYEPTLKIGSQIVALDAAGTGTMALQADQKYNIQLSYRFNGQLSSAQPDGVDAASMILMWECAGQPLQAVPSHRLFPALNDSTDYPVPADRALGLGATAPSVMVLGTSSNATVTFRNTGTTTWTPQTHRLAVRKSVETVTWRGEWIEELGTLKYVTVRGPNAWVFKNPVFSPLLSNVAPGQDVTWTVPVTMGYQEKDINFAIDNFTTDNNNNPVTLKTLSKDITVKVNSDFNPILKLEIVSTTPNSVRVKLPSLPSYGISYTLQRAVGSPATTVASVPTAGRAQWFRAGDLYLPEGSPVTKWKSAAGSGVASQTVLGSAPVWTSNGPQGYPVVRFDGINDLMPTNVALPGSALTVFVVAKAAAINNYGPILNNQGNGTGFLYPRFDQYGGFSSKFWVFSDQNHQIESGFVPNEWNIGSAKWQLNSADGMSAWRNGVNKNNAAVATTGSTAPILGSLILGSTGGDGFRGDVAEILTYDRVLSDTERSGVENYLAHKYGISFGVPDNLNWTNVATNLQGETTYDDVPLTPNTVYWYRAVLKTAGADVTTDAAMATTRPPAGSPPGVPGAPAGGTLLPESINVTAPGPNLPLNTDYLKLQVKMPTQDDSEYVDVQGAVGAGEQKLASGLTPETTYRFRFVAVGPGGVTPGVLYADYTTQSSQVPGVPQFSNIGRNSVTVTMPSLPSLAKSLTLMYKESSPQGAPNFVQVPEEGSYPGLPKATPASRLLGGEAVVTITGLKSNTAYLFQAVAVFHEENEVPDPNLPNLSGQAGGFSTYDFLPEIPTEPSFRNIGPTSVDVISQPNLPDHATSLTLQGRLFSEDSSWVDVVTGLVPFSDSLEIPPHVNYSTVSNLARGATYSFRYVAFGPGGSAEGPSANVTLQTPLVIWRPGSAIECSGIRWPSAGTQITQGSTIKLQSFVGVDWDARDIYSGGLTRTDRYTDACTYTWTCSAECFEKGGGFLKGATRVASIRSKNPQFVAPSAGLWPIALVVDDQGGLNIGNGDTGTRDDAAKGYNDDPVKFAVTVNVIP